MTRRQNLPRLLEVYETYLRGRWNIKESTRKTYLRDANTVLACVVSQLSENEIQAIVAKQQCRGYYGNVIRDLKAITTRRIT